MVNETDIVRAVREGNIKLLKALVNSGADVNEVDDQGLAPLHHCCVSNIPGIVRTLLRADKIDLNKKTHFYQTPLLLAAYHNNFMVYCRLLAKGADPNSSVMFNQTVLHYVVREGKYDFVKEIIAYGADVNCLDCFGVSPLRIHLKATMDVKITQLLIKNGADINETKFEQVSILKIALLRWRQDKLRNVHYMINHGADINASNTVGETALHWAAFSSPPSIIKILVLRYGADVMARNMFGRKPLDIAIMFQNHENMFMLRYLEYLETEKQMRALGI